MGDVYRAHSLTKRQTVALKVLREDLAANKDYVRRFRHEGAIADAIIHPNIAQVYERGEHQGRCYLAMEYLQGVTLRMRLQQTGRIPVDEAVAIGAALCDALEAIHARAIIHRDLKPENIMLAGRETDHQVKLVDFGLAKSLALSTLTIAGSIAGTLAYVSPEQLRGEASDGRSDLFALGVTFYEMLTGQRPFQGESEAEVLATILKDEPTPIRELRPEVDIRLARIVARLMRKFPQDRYESAADVKIELLKSIGYVQGVAAT
jgi:serine/threonine-protein kinase